MRYYISDLHFFHENLNNRLDMRGFENVQAMNNYIIEKWNSRVRKNDEVVILGDFSMAKGPETNEVLSRLKGKKYLIVGNHDLFLNDKHFDETAFKWIHNYKEMSDNGRKVILSHYPVFCYNKQNSLTKTGKPRTYMLYGHVHNTLDELLVNKFIRETAETSRLSLSGHVSSIPCNMINCFCMFSDYTPLTLDEWIEVDKKRREYINSNEEALFKEKSAPSASFEDPEEEETEEREN